VLILDDDIDLTRLYGVYLRERGYAIRVAANHEELQEQLAQAIPDLIVLDVLMPRWDGWSILQQLRAETETAKVPIVICSVLPQADLALSLGADRVLQKPVSRGQLVETVHELLAAANSPH
jgi:DNA-binding response OmpR family regulator